MEPEILINHILAWHESKGHIFEGNEYKELETASKKGNFRNLIDAIGDCLVVTIGICANLKLNPYGIIKTAINDNFCIEKSLTIHLGNIAECMLKQKTQFYTESIYNFCVALFQFSKSENIEPIYALSRAYDEIKDRVGVTINGSFIKNEDLK